MTNPSNRLRIAPRASFVPPLLTALAVLLLGSALLVGCGDSEKSYVVQDVRHVPAAPAAEAGSGSWGYALPPGWKAVPPGQFQELRFSVPARKDLDASLAVAGGGLLANLNRWRHQMGLAETTQDQVDALPRRPFLGGQAHFVDLQGAFAGMGGQVRIPEARLIGYVLDMGGQMVFLKMVGPADAVAAELGHLQALADSLRPPSPSAAPGPETSLPAGHPSVPGMGSMPGAAPSGPSEVTWKAPEGWTKQGPRMMREVTYVPATAPDCECWITLAGGDLLGNVNRWRGQMSQTPVTQADVDKLRRVEVNGQQGMLVEIRGPYTGTGGKTVEDATMLALVVPREEQSVFVKMVGPSDQMAQQKDNFLAFCQSIHW